MGRTFIRQATQIRNSDVYDDTLAAGSTLESAPADIEDDLNGTRSQVNRLIKADGSGNWYDDIATVNGKKRAVTELNTDLDDIEEKRLLFRAAVMTDVTVPTGVAATGSITTVAGSALVDTETFTLNDGVNTPTVFEFDSGGGVTGGHTAVTFTGGMTADQVRDAIISAVNGVTTTLLITASSGGAATVTLTHDRKGTVGNRTLSETVADAGFVITNMTGGAGDKVTLSVSASETPTVTAAVNGGTAEGAVVADLPADVVQVSLVEVSGPDAISPKNLVLIRDAVTGDPISSSNEEVFGLLQAESGVADGDAFSDTTKQVQISFVRRNATGDDLEVCPGDDIGGKVINYAYVRRVKFDNIPEYAFLSGTFLDQVPTSTSVTLDSAIDNQVGPATQTDRDINWRITDTFHLRFQDSGGSVNLIDIAPASGGDQIQINIDTLDINNVNSVDFLNGAVFDSGGTAISVGATAGEISSAAALTVASGGSSDLGLTAAGEFAFVDGNKGGSTFAGQLKLSDTAQEWSDYETAFGEVSLLKAITMGADVFGKTVATVTGPVPADTNVTGVGGGANIDAQLGDYSGATFTTHVNVYVNGVLCFNGANSGANNDVYPGTTPANGDLKFEFALKTNDVITMEIFD